MTAALAIWVVLTAQSLSWIWIEENKRLVLEAEHCMDVGGYPITVNSPAARLGRPLQIHCIHKSKKKENGY